MYQEKIYSLNPFPREEKSDSYRKKMVLGLLVYLLKSLGRCDRLHPFTQNIIM